MKKLFVSVGLVAAGATSIQPVLGEGLDLISPNSWSVSGNLRGFYDDNYNIAPGKKGSFGAEVSPSVSYNLPLQQTDMGIRYTYGLYYYQDRQDIGVNPFDQTHQVDLWFDHAINERWHINFTDTFASGQEPELISAGTTVNPGTLFRVNGNNIGNHAKISLDTQWTPLFGTSLHYQNDFYDYDNSGASVTNGYAGSSIQASFPLLFSPNTPGKMDQYNQFAGNGGQASLAGLLNRVDQNIGLDLNWTLGPTTKIIAGYSFDWVAYTGNEPIAIFNYNTPGPGTFGGNKSLVYQSDSRNNITHTIYAGLNYQLTQNLSFLGTVGVEYTDNYNDPLNNANSFGPTANMSLSYTYSSGSYAQLGIQQGENATYIVQPAANGDITQYQNSSTIYADVNQRIFEKLMATVIGRYIYSTYEGGAASTQSDDYYSFGVDLTYQFSRHFSADVGYNYDDLQSNIPGNGYNRNRVYIGLGANY